MKKNLRRLTALALGLAMLFTLTAALAGKPTAQELDKLLTGRTDKSNITSPVIDAVNKARKSVVGINIYAEALPPPGEALQEEPMSIGSGTVVSPWGHVLTNFHVVHNAQGITVVHEGEEYAAYLIDSEPDRDLAVVFAPELKLQPVEFGDSDALQIGEWALVIGNPMGHDLDRSVFIGVISAVKRAVEGYGVEDRYGKLHTSTQLMIQTDAAVNPGGSGGGLFNILGQLQGVPTLKISEGSMDEPSPDPGASQEKPLPVDNIGMCVPIKDAMPLIRRALETYDGTGKPPVKTGDDAAPERPRVGVLLRVLDEGLQPRRDKQIPRGLLVEEVDKGGPAQKAGVRPGDILVAWNNRPTADLNALNLAREQEDVQQPVTLTIYRSPGLLEVITGQSGDPRMLEGDYQELSLRLDNP